MARWTLTAFSPKGTARPIAVSQLASLIAFGVILGAEGRRPLLTGIAFAVALVTFAFAAGAIAVALRRLQRGLFMVAAIAALAGALLVAVALLVAHARGTSLRFATDLEIAVILATINALLTLYGGYALAQERSAAEGLARRIEAERELSAALEVAVGERTVELERARAIVQRMWVLGQQVAQELEPERVTDQFLEALTDILKVDGAAVGLTEPDGRIRLVNGIGLAREWVGHQLPIVGSAMGRVVRLGGRWRAEDLRRIIPGLDDDSDASQVEMHRESMGRLAEQIRGIAYIPIARRGERIGVVGVGSVNPRLFTDEELDHVEAMADLLAVALENAGLVDTLRRAEWRFRTLFRNAPDIVLTVLQSGRIREANDVVRDVIGLDPVQVVGRELTSLVDPTDANELGSALARAFAGSAERVEVGVTNAVTERRHAVALAMRSLPEADPPSVLIIGRDTTQERDMRMRLMESDRLAAVGELVAGVAHEVNNPLSSISAFAQLLLRDQGLSAAQRDSIEVIKSETLRASQVVRDLLAFARRSEPQRAAIDLNAIVARTIRLRGYELNSAHVSVEQVLAADLPPVLGDSRQLQQVCLNLVTNAVQAMGPQGSGTLRVTTRTEDDGESVVLEMRDTGPGIPAAARGRIFEPFFTTKGEGEGTGLGLSVSYGIVAAHGGRLELVETSAQGTVFRMTLPVAPIDAPDGPHRDSGGAAVRSPLAGMRLLFVDDEPALRSGVEAYGKMRGFSVLTAPDGESALEIVRRTGVDVVVCDLRMPSMDGVAFHERLRRERPGLATRTVFVTGDVVTSRPTNMRQPVLTKPFTFERLEELLASVVRPGPAVRVSLPIRPAE